MGPTERLILVEPGSGEMFDIDEGFADFLNIDLVGSPDTYLESELFEQWRDAGGGVPGVDQCVGFKLPLFLGGAGAIDNLELYDVEVYWDLCGQMRQAIRGLAPGTAIGGFNIA